MSAASQLLLTLNEPHTLEDHAAAIGAAGYFYTEAYKKLLNSEYILFANSTSVFHFCFATDEQIIGETEYVC